MGRPRKDSTEISVIEKIENAFWKILETEDYRSITILRLTQESNVNRNSIYYHYKNVEDIAQKAFEHNTGQEFMADFMSIIMGNDYTPASDEQVLLHIKKIHLLAGSESAFFQSLVKHSIIKTWFSIFLIDPSTLSDTDHLVLNFIASGVTDMLGSNLIKDHPDILRSFPSTPLGKTAIRTLQDMSYNN